MRERTLRRYQFEHTGIRRPPGREQPSSETSRLEAKRVWRAIPAPSGLFQLFSLGFLGMMDMGSNGARRNAQADRYVFCRRPQTVVVEVGISLRRLRGGVTQEFTDDEQRLSRRRHQTGNRVAQVLNQVIYTNRVILFLKHGKYCYSTGKYFMK